MVDVDKLFSKMPVFTGKIEQWQGWKRKFLAILDSSDLLKGLYEDRPLDAPEGSENVEIQAARDLQDAWDKQSRTIYNRLSFFTEGNAAGLVMQHEATRNGREAWMQLVNKYEHVGSIGKAADPERADTDKNG